MFLWSYILGCFYLGWTAYTTYTGGRFEGFGGPDIGEANAGALTLVTGMFAAGPLFLTGKTWEKFALIGLMPIIVNGMITAASRSALLAVVTGGLLFLWYTPKAYRRRVKILGMLAVVLFFMLTNPFYWGRMSTLKHAGEDTKVETQTGRTYDTGHGRLVIMQAQWRMFLSNPLGHGHRGTAALSPFYLSDEHLTGQEGQRARSSHNTFLTLLVEHGVVGAGVYIFMVWWLYRTVRRVRKAYLFRSDFRAAMVPAVVAILGCIVIGDVFVDYLKLEPRLWFLAVIMIMATWAREDAAVTAPTGIAVASATPHTSGVR
jgi:hypothetical protein